MQLQVFDASTILLSQQLKQRSDDEHVLQPELQDEQVVDEDE